jgi:hypothetical protein
MRGCALKRLTRNLLGLVALTSFVALAAQAEELVSTSKPFEVGDVWVAATVMNDPDDDHRGVGRLLQYDADFNLKGELWIPATSHKLGGLKFGPDGTLWAFAPISWQVVEVGTDGKQKPMRQLANRALSTVTFGHDGELFFGEHLVGTNRKIPYNSTQFQYLPFTQRIGNGNLFKFSPEGRLLEEFEVDTHGGMAGIHGATNTVLTADGKRMIYCSETGNRIMQYDLEQRKQLPDLRVFDPAKGEPSMVVFMESLQDGTLIVATGAQLLLLDPDTGETLNTIDMPNNGWAAVSAAADGEHILAGNFFTGEFVKVRLADGEVVTRGDIGVKRSLSGIVQFPGLTSAIAKQHQRDLDNAYVEVIAASEEAFMRRDIDGAVANLDDDYVLYQIGEDGPRERMRGIDTVRTLLGGFFEANTTWVGSEVERLTLMDNILVQVEYDFFETEAGTQTIPTLVVFEHRDGNRWREWRFAPQRR